MVTTKDFQPSTATIVDNKMRVDGKDLVGIMLDLVRVVGSRSIYVEVVDSVDRFMIDVVDAKRMSIVLNVNFLTIVDSGSVVRFACC